MAEKPREVTTPSTNERPRPERRPHNPPRQTTPPQIERRTAIAEHSTTISRSPTYATATRARNGVPKVMLYGDSHLNRIKGKELKRCVPGCLPIVRSFSGATAKHLRHYVQPTIEEERPEFVLLHVGTNNITKRAHQKSPMELAAEIVGIADHCRQEGAKTVFISSVLTLQRPWQVRMVNQVNFYLKSLCEEKNHVFIDNDNIDSAKLWEDGIHLIDHGRDMLGTNFIRAFRSFIPSCSYPVAWHA